MPQRRFLRVTVRNGYVDDSVTKAEISNTVSAGIRWGALGPEMVPIFEEQSVRLLYKYTIEQWLLLDSMERAIMVATRRIEIAMDNLQNDAQIRKMKQDHKRGMK